MKPIKLKKVIPSYKGKLNGWKMTANRNKTLKLLTPEIQELISDYLKLDYPSSSELKKKLEGKSYKVVNCGYSTVIFENKNDIVFKIGGTHCSGDDDVAQGKITFLKDSIDTIFIWKQGDNDVEFIRIQPKVELKGGFKKALDKFVHKYPDCDIHSGNIGRYKKKIVLFDW